VIAPRFIDQEAVLDQVSAVIAHIHSGEFALEWNAEQ